MTLSEAEIQRYARHLSLPEIGRAGQERLKAAKVLCVGVGGLGSPLSLYLTAAGVGTLGLIDDDRVALSNLQRQILYTECDCNIKKTIAAQQRLSMLNSNIKIETHEQRLTYDNAPEIFNNYDIIADCSDNFATRYLVNDICWQLKKPDVYAAIFQYEGQCSIFGTADGPCYRCLFAEPPPDNLAIDFAHAGLLGALPGVMGAIQATEVLKLVLQLGSPLIGRLLSYDLLDMEFRNLKITTDKNCTLCQNHT